MGSYYLDWYSESAVGHTAYEIAGCFYHGCPECIDAITVDTLRKHNFGNMYHNFQEKCCNVGAGMGKT